MKIREIQKKDNRQVQRLIQKTLKSFNLDIPGTAYYDPQLANLTEYYQRKGHGSYWVVVTDQDQVVGCGGFGPFGQETTICELQKLYVAPAAQGQGISRLLMDKILGEAAKEYQGIYLETTERLDIANRLYQKYGFELLEEPLAGSEHGAMELWYLKKLDESN